MKINILKPDNDILIVDEEEFQRIHTIAHLKEEEVEKLAEEKYLRYIRESGINISLQLNTIPGILRHDIVSELNYDERGYPESVSDEIKHAIVDDITGYIVDYFKNYKDECDKYLKIEWNRYRAKYDRKIKYWRGLFIITFICFLVECISLL